MSPERPNEVQLEHLHLMALKHRNLISNHSVTYLQPIHRINKMLIHIDLCQTLEGKFQSRYVQLEDVDMLGRL